MRIWFAAMTVTMLGAGCAERSGPVGPVTPACDHPAPLEGVLDPNAPGFIVEFHAGVDADLESHRLGGVYGFAPQHVYSTIPGFSALIDEAALPMIQCEPSVDLIERDGEGQGA